MIMNSLSLVNRDAGRLLRLDVRLLLSSAATPSAHGICGQRCDAHHIAVCPKSKRSQKGVQRIIFGHGKMEQGRVLDPLLHLPAGAAHAFAIGPPMRYAKNVNAQMVKRLIWVVLSAAVLQLGAIRSSCLPGASNQPCAPCCPAPASMPAQGNTAPEPSCCLVTVYRAESATAIAEHSGSRAKTSVPTAGRLVVPAGLATVSTHLLSHLPGRLQSPPVARLEQSCLLRI